MYVCAFRTVSDDAASYILSLDLLSRIDLDELMKKDEPPFNFPNNLEEFEYAFNESKLFLYTCFLCVFGNPLYF